MNKGLGHGSAVHELRAYVKMDGTDICKFVFACVEGQTLFTKSPTENAR